MSERLNQSQAPPEKSTVGKAEVADIDFTAGNRSDFIGYLPLPGVMCIL